MPIKREFLAELQERFRLLVEVYKAAGGVADGRIVNIEDLADKARIHPGLVLDTFRELKDSGLTKWAGYCGNGCITSEGVRVVELALNQQRIPYFPASVASMCRGLMGAP